MNGASSERRVIWLTRPAGQADALREALEERGAIVFHLPLIEIVPLPPDQAIRDRVLALDRYDLAFFVSGNAVHWGMERILDYWPQYPAHIQNFTVGGGTARALERLGLNAHYPREGTTSEALLALPELADVRGRKALIVRGQGGREVLAGELRARGAEVDYLEVYRRQVPQYEESWLREQVMNHSPDGIVITSAEALDNFVGLFGTLWPAMRKVEVLVPSQRIAGAARDHGFERVTLMEGADDAAILSALKSL